MEFPGVKYRVVFGPRSDGFAPNINVVDEDFLGSLSDYVDANLNIMRTVFARFTILSRERFLTEDGVAGEKVVTENVQQDKELRQTFFFLTSGSKKFVVTCSSLSKDGKAFDQTFEKSLESFRFDVLGGDSLRTAIDGNDDEDVDRDFPLAAAKAGERDLAVVIGNKEYRSEGVFPVEYADRDAAAMRDLLVRSFGFDSKNVLFIPDAGYTKFVDLFGPPGRPSVGRVFKMAAAAGGTASVFIYYAGHGAPSLETNEAFLVPVDAELSSLDATGYPLKALYAAVNAMPVRSATVVLDACFSGSSDKGLIFQGISPARVKVSDAHAAPPKAVLFSSGSVDQVSTWFPEKGHSLFTYYFLKGIRGAADADADAAVTVAELKSYLARTVPFEAQRLKGINQTPVVFGNGSEVMVRFAR